MKTQFDEGDIAVACLTVDEMPEPYEKGSTPHQCAECDARLWCGPSTILGIMWRHPSAHLVFMCCNCIATAHRENATAEFQVLPEQLNAIRLWESRRGPR